VNGRPRRAPLAVLTAAVLATAACAPTSIAPSGSAAPGATAEATDPRVAPSTPAPAASSSEPASTQPAGELRTDVAIRAAHILFSPFDDPAGAARVHPDHPEWAEAEAEARATAAELVDIADADERETRFDALARSSDDTGSGANGGDLGFSLYEDLVPEFALPLFTGQHARGDILGPLRSDFGWHVVMYLEELPRDEA
jgi:hypothetical protein